MTGDSKAAYTPLSASDDAPPPAYDAALAAPDSHLLASRNTALRAQQPTAVPQMVVGGPRNSKAQRIGDDGKREFNHGLCSWYETPGTTAAAACCPCVVFSRNRSRLTHLTQTGEALDSPSNVSPWCCLYALAPQFFGIGQVALQCLARMQTRQRYGVRGNVVEDVLVSAFCTTCTLVQESRELSDEELFLRNQEGLQVVEPEVFYRDEEEAIAPAPAVEVVVTAPGEEAERMAKKGEPLA
ncbi:hypothetical protein JCM8097_002163 [Rhodosporidiobolus ruineniae]